MYPNIDPDKLARALNISSDCVVALNRTLPECDQDLFQMVGDFENFWWEDDNITTLCLGNCQKNTSDWMFDLYSECNGDYISAYGKQLAASSIGERYNDGMNLVCQPSNSANFTWCLTESQEWVGSDIVRVDCSVNPGDPTCGGDASEIPAANMRMANIYSDDIGSGKLCNECFIALLYERVTSSLLTNEDYSDYLVDQLQDIGDICSTSIRPLTLRAITTYDPAPPITSISLNNGSTPTTSIPPAAITCAGQTVSSGSGCDGLSTQYGIATGDLQVATNSSTCQVTAAVCLPAACTVQQVANGQTCDTLASSFKITAVQFLSWNRNILGLCDNPTLGQYVCASAPGTNSSYVLPPPPLGTDADAGNQQRGGPGGVVTPTSTVSTTITDPASQGSASAPSPTQDGLVSNCNNYAIVKTGDTCFDFAKDHGVTTDQLYAWNPVLGLNGANCSTNFWASEYYCIGVWATATTSVTAPGPTQSGIVANCDKYAQTQQGDGCDTFASRNSISNAQLYAWNAVLGSKGENCGSSLWANEWYCVGISAPPASPTTSTRSSSTTKVTAPGPTQTGIADNCNKYAEAAVGDTCSGFATKNGITTTQLYAWNTVLGANGENCASSFWGNEYYCVGTS
ncbi:uncharacterized protein F4822DRAFT_440959 [Hypoxylon trugodes]|uniref:uncharacterized protein n=1 Tax=Hypoxylon trugodes TaxID=326681 RepID=UPI00219BEF7C|nr:uncharacterized protein F4822DRAFT_440959 [Hypoxylon trugodes]KAI1382676.1 hypothetical protein F4822DRAFT_440959 [Hypoxylon trugodes]